MRDNRKRIILIIKLDFMIVAQVGDIKINYRFQRCDHQKISKF
jgi:hypothetical protein